MIDEHNEDGTGWAQFSDDRKLRYRLGRALTPLGRDWLIAGGRITDDGRLVQRLVRITFAMLNPSTADAFKLDPTVHKCCEFAKLWGADVLEVVNIFALRSTDPKGLDVPGIDTGDGPDNDAAILKACTGATRVIAAWGNHGWRRDRGARVRDMLHRAGIRLEHLGTTKEGYPLHPLARGKAFIPLTREPVVFVDDMMKSIKDQL